MPERREKVDLVPAEGPQKSYQPENWAPRHAEVARLYGAGFTPQQIHALTGYHTNTISQIVNDERALPFIREGMQIKLDKATDLNQRFREAADQAFEEIQWQMMNPLEKPIIRQRAAFGILDRAGYTPINKHALVPPPPVLPDGLGQVIKEAHEEITQIKRTVLFEAPPEADAAAIEAREVALLTEGLKDE